MLTQTVTTSAGYYGKLPAVGDFVRFNLGRAFIEPWDDWLQAAISRGREQMGEHWLQAYLTSPIYRYVLTPGICGENAWKGVIMPSVDRVGRYFPLTICAPLNAAENPFHCLLQQTAWFEKAEQLVLSTLEDDLGLEQLQASLSELDNLTTPTDEVSSDLPFDEHLIQQSLAIRAELPQDADEIHRQYPQLLHQVLLKTGFAYSLWRTEGSDSMSASLLLSQGLPPAASVCAMLDGHWSQWGWQDNNPLPGVVIPSVDGDTDPWEL